MRIHTLLLVLIAVHICSASVEHSANKEDFPVTWSSVWAAGAENHGAYKLNSVQAWSALTLDSLQWIQVSALKNQWWTAVATQGRADNLQLVSRFRVSASKNGVQWTWVDGGREYIGNYDSKSEMRNNFDKPVYARHIRIHPTAWNHHISLRFDAYYVTK